MEQTKKLNKAKLSEILNSLVAKKSWYFSFLVTWQCFYSLVQLNIPGTHSQTQRSWKHVGIKAGQVQQRIMISPPPPPPNCACIAQVLLCGRLLLCTQNNNRVHFRYIDCMDRFFFLSFLVRTLNNCFEKIRGICRGKKTFSLFFVDAVPKETCIVSCPWVMSIAESRNKNVQAAKRWSRVIH